MRFSITVNMGRLDLTTEMRQIADQALELVNIADQGGATSSGPLSTTR